MNTKSFGLDIGLTTIKAVWLSKDKNGFSVDASITSPSTQKGMMSESPLDEEEMARAISKTISDAKITSKSVNIALPENNVYTKVIEMPNLSDRELSSAIYWEAEQHIPVPLSTITLAWSVLKRPQKEAVSEKMQVLMVGAPTLLIKKYQKITTMAGLTIKLLETEILSIVRALVTSSDFPPSVIINIGSLSTSLALIRDGTIVLTYSISTGGLAISRAITADYGLTPERAEEYNKTHEVSGQAIGEKESNAAVPILNSILTELKKALAFYSEKYNNDKPISQIFLTGGAAKLPGIDVYFAQNTNTKIIIANPWQILSDQNTLPKAILDSSPDYTIAVGLAMRDYEE